jgi:hypothetical protein
MMVEGSTAALPPVEAWRFDLGEPRLGRDRRAEPARDLLVRLWMMKAARDCGRRPAVLERSLGGSATLLAFRCKNDAARGDPRELGDARVRALDVRGLSGTGPPAEPDRELADRECVFNREQLLELITRTHYELLRSTRLNGGGPPPQEAGFCKRRAAPLPTSSMAAHLATTQGKGFDLVRRRPGNCGNGSIADHGYGTYRSRRCGTAGRSCTEDSKGKSGPGADAIADARIETRGTAVKGPHDRRHHRGPIPPANVVMSRAKGAGSS